VGEEKKGEGQFPRISFYSVLTGLCPLIPIPILDDKVLEYLQRRLARELAADVGAPLTETQIQILTGTERQFRPLGCIFAALIWLPAKIAIKLIRKIFRYVLLFLVLNEAAEKSSKTLHEGYLIRLLLEHGRLPYQDEDAARRARTAIESACGEVDTRPVFQAIKRTFRGSRRMMRQAARLLARAFRRNPDNVPLEQGEPLLGDLAAGVSDTMASKASYLAALEARCVAHLQAMESTETSTADSSSCQVEGDSPA
jgi:hypothetical protein